MAKRTKYSPDNILGWSEVDFAYMQEMLLTTFTLNNQRAPDFLIANHNDNCTLISLAQNEEEREREREQAEEKEREDFYARLRRK